MNIQVKDFTDLELKNEVGTLFQDGFIFHYEQNLSKDELVKFCRRIGNTDDDTAGWYSYNPKDNPDISRVMPGGLFGGTELHWHSNGTVHHLGEFKEILIALYCKEECVDTVFSLMNNRDAFLELPEEEKDYWRSIEIQLNNFGHGIYGSSEEAKDDNSLDDYIKMEPHTDNERMPAVNIHPVGGQEFLYWQPPLIEKAWQDGVPIDVSLLQEKYKKVLQRTKYIKDIVFREGDLLIMDQLYTLHRRSNIKNKTRELWRVAFDYTTIINE